MGGIGGCCCDTVCCDTLTVPSGWTLVADCCAEKVTTITEDWTVVCSDSARTDTRSASVNYKVWKTPRPDYDETDFTAITCITDPVTGIETCTGSGGAFPPCDDETEELCNTITETHSRITESRLVVRYKRVRRVDTLARVETACDGGASTCKWILISKTVYLVQSAQTDFLDDDYSITDTATDACCGAYNTTTSVLDTCAAKAAGLSGGTEVALCRAKYYTSAPSGTITFDPGDTIDCTPLTDPCTSLCPDEVDICTTDPGAISWTAPTCETATESILCLVVVHYEDPLNPDTYLCDRYPNGDVITVYRVRISGGEFIADDLLYGISLDGYLCDDDCDVRPSSYYINRIECDGLTSSQSDSGYVEKCITLSSAAWSITV
jgi:hypothetical protein